MRKTLAPAAALAVILFAWPTPGAAHEGHKKKAEGKATIVGQVVGTACYLGHSSSGTDHAECAATCAKKGIPLAILDVKTKQLYLPLSSNHHKAANEELTPFIEKGVRVTGKVIEKGGMNAILIEKIEAAD